MVAGDPNYAFADVVLSKRCGAGLTPVRIVLT